MDRSHKGNSKMDQKDALNIARQYYRQAEITSRFKKLKQNVHFMETFHLSPDRGEIFVDWGVSPR